MAYDEVLASRIRGVLEGEPAVVEKRMFGGLAFVVQGNMAVAASGQGGLMLRVDPDQSDLMLEQRGVQPMEMRGKAARGWLRVAPEAVDSDVDLERWVELGVSYARSLPPK